MPSIRTKRFAPVNFNTAASQQIVAAQGAGNKIKVVSLFLVAAGAVVVTFQSAAGALSGPMSMVAGTPFALDAGDEFGHLLETNPNEALNILLGGAVQVSGWIGYVVDRQ